MRVHCWYERRLGGVAASSQVSVATQLLLGGDLLQRACRLKYTAGHVHQVAATLVDGILALQAIGVCHIDLAPWTLLYATPQNAPLATGLAISNAGFGAPLARRSATTPLRAAFEPPELEAADGLREGPGAVWALGRVLRLLLSGAVPAAPETGGGTDGVPAQPADAQGRHSQGGQPTDGSSVASASTVDAAAAAALSSARMSAAIPPEAVVMLDDLCRALPEERPRAEDVMSLPWFASVASSANVGHGLGLGLGIG